MQELGQDNFGSVDYRTFLVAFIDKKVYTKPGYMKAAFKFFDTDKDNYITVNDLMNSIRRASYNPRKSHFERAFNEVDEVGQGKMNED